MNRFLKKAKTNCNGHEVKMNWEKADEQTVIFDLESQIREIIISLCW